MKNSDASDQRPPLWVGHIALTTDRLTESYAFMQKIGMRGLIEAEEFGVLEMRAGTHLILRVGDDHAPGDAPFDLMVEDLEATHKQMIELGLEPSEIEPGNIHQSFTMREPSGHLLKFNSSHNSDQPV